MSENNLKNRLTRGNAGKTILQLVIASIIVGALFSFLGIGPRDFWRGVFRNVQNIVGALGENISEVLLTLSTYFLIGAAVVIPIWLIARLLSSRK